MKLVSGICPELVFAALPVRVFAAQWQTLRGRLSWCDPSAIEVTGSNADMTGTRRTRQTDDCTRTCRQAAASQQRIEFPKVAKGQPAKKKVGLNSLNPAEPAAAAEISHSASSFQVSWGKSRRIADQCRIAWNKFMAYPCGLPLEQLEGSSCTGARFAKGNLRVLCCQKEFLSICSKNTAPCCRGTSGSMLPACSL